MEESKQNPKAADIVNEIAQNIDMGMDCYYRPKTKEVLTLFSEDMLMEYGDEEEYRTAFKDSLEKIEGHEEDFIKVGPLEGLESFKMMEHFVAEVPDPAFQNKLSNVLERRKPFRNFKFLIDNSPFREDWFVFKQSELEKIVKNVLVANGVEF